MIRAIEERDYKAVCRIVNDNWRRVYGGFVNPRQVSAEGCAERERRLFGDFADGRLSEYIFEENGIVAGMISFGRSGETDCPGALEIWRLYVDGPAQGRGIGGELLGFAESGIRGRVFIWAFRENERALAFYRKHGYTVDKEEYLESFSAVGVRLYKLI